MACYVARSSETFFAALKKSFETAERPGAESRRS
jgi:hypothetical protein